MSEIIFTKSDNPREFNEVLTLINRLLEGGITTSDGFALISYGRKIAKYGYIPSDIYQLIKDKEKEDNQDD